jgi:hypothetical protein
MIFVASRSREAALRRSFSRDQRDMSHAFLPRIERQTSSASGVVQLTPHGSSCSVQFGAMLTSAAPGSGKGYLIVSDIVAARNKLVDAGIEVNEIFHLGPKRPGRRSGSGARQLPLSRHVRRSRRQQLAATGNYDAASRAR